MRKGWDGEDVEAENHECVRTNVFVRMCVCVYVCVCVCAENHEMLAWAYGAVKAALRMYAGCIKGEGTHERLASSYAALHLARAFQALRTEACQKGN